MKFIHFIVEKLSKHVDKSCFWGVINIFINESTNAVVFLV